MWKKISSTLLSLLRPSVFFAVTMSWLAYTQLRPTQFGDTTVISSGQYTIIIPDQRPNTHNSPHPSGSVFLHTSADFAASVTQGNLLGLGAVELRTGLAGDDSVHRPVL